jgi:hypothetical protein
MEALRSSETSVLTRATWRNIPEDGIFHSHRRENLKSYITLELHKILDSSLVDGQQSVSLKGVSFVELLGLLTADRAVAQVVRRNLQLLLGLASAVALGSESRGTHDHTLLSQYGDSHILQGQVPVFLSPRNRLAQLYPGALTGLGSHSVASTTRRATVEVF